MQTSEKTDYQEVVREVAITPKLVLVILGPYFVQRVWAQVTAVLPISLFLFVFQVIVLHQPVSGGLAIAAGLTAVVLGLMFFMEGLKLGLMPLGESIGATMPAKATISLVLGFAFVLGVGATFAEPAISTLKAAGANVKPQDAPLLYEMLNRSSHLLVGSVGFGVGIATVLGVYRFVRHWRLRTLLLPSLFLPLTLTVIAAANEETRQIISLAWDTGAVTTGPVTVPLVLALGLGVSTVLNKSDAGVNCFGIVTLASLWPISAVLAMSLFLFFSGNYAVPSEAAVLAQSSAAAGASSPPLLGLLAASIQTALQAVVPLMLLLFVVQKYLLREDVSNSSQIILGVIFSIIGLGLFNLGLFTGLVPLGQQVGGHVPLAFAPPEAIYGPTLGKVIAVAFAFALGYGATLAEPALNAMGITVEEVTAGAFKKPFLMHAVAFGVGMGLAAGVIKIIFHIPLEYMVLPAYALLTIVTLVSDEEFINIAWDSAGVTTGPITVPLVLALGLGIGITVNAPEGFGMLALASIGPILSVLTLGLIVSTVGRTRRVNPALAAA